MTERLEVRSFQDADNNDFFLLLTNPLVNSSVGAAQFLSHPHLVNQFLKQMLLKDDVSQSWLLYSILDRANHQFIGGCGIKIEQENRRGEIFYLLFPRYWGRGLAAEACRPILDNAFNQCGLGSIEVLIIPENRRAQRVAHKLGFRYLKTVHLNRYGQRRKVQKWTLLATDLAYINHD